MKRMLSLALTLAMALSLTACGGGGGSETPPSGGGNQSAVQSGGQTESQGGKAEAMDLSMFENYSPIGKKLSELGYGNTDGDLSPDFDEYIASFQPQAVADYYALTAGDEDKLVDYTCQNPDEDFTYQINEEKDYLVCTGIANIQPSLTIPASVDGHPVLRVAIDKSYPQVTDITLSEGILEVRNLGWKKLKTVALPESLLILTGLEMKPSDELILPQNLFRLAVPDTKKVTIPASVEVLESSFGGADTTEITFEGDGPRLIQYCFNKDGLERIEIPAGVEFIYQSFSECDNLAEVTFAGEKLLAVERSFNSWKNLKKLSWPDSVEYLDNSSLGYSLVIEEIHEPASLKGIAYKSQYNGMFEETPYAQKFEGGFVIWNDGWLIGSYGGEQDIVVPDSAKVILPSSIVTKNATSITIPGSVHTICAGAIGNANAGGDTFRLVLEDGVTDIQRYGINLEEISDVTYHIAVPASLTDEVIENFSERVSTGRAKEVVYHAAKSNKTLEAMCEAHQEGYNTPWTYTTDSIA